MDFTQDSVSTGSWQAMPPGQGKCRNCAVAHDDMDPHDATSFYYRFLFVNTHGRDATWADAMAHCEPEVQRAWTRYLNSIGIDVNSTNVRGGMTSQAELDERLAKLND
jgi:hypothetical protein